MIFHNNEINLTLNSDAVKGGIGGNCYDDSNNYKGKGGNGGNGSYMIYRITD